MARMTEDWKELLNEEIRKRKSEFFTKTYEDERAMFTYTLTKAVPIAYATNPIIIDCDMFAELERWDKGNHGRDFFQIYLGRCIADSGRKKMPFAENFYDFIESPLIKILSEVYQQAMQKSVHEFKVGLGLESR